MLVNVIFCELYDPETGALAANLIYNVPETEPEEGGKFTELAHVVPFEETSKPDGAVAVKFAVKYDPVMAKDWEAEAVP